MFLFESHEFPIMFCLYCRVNPHENSTFETLVKNGQEYVVSFQSLFTTDSFVLTVCTLFNFHVWRKMLTVRNGLELCIFLSIFVFC